MALKSPYQNSPDEWSEILIQKYQVQSQKVRYRTKQICEWLYNKTTPDFSAMTNIPLDLREKLQSDFSKPMIQIAKCESSQDGTKKYLLRLNDDQFIEMVTIPEKKKLTLCISSQVGCSRGCIFCATAIIGLARNLDSSEIIEQIIIAISDNPDRDLTNIVFMGMGEPLDNLDNLIKAVTTIQNDLTLSFSPRRTTISTCGVVPGLSKLADSGLKIKLALSLNSAIQAKREQLMPIAKKYPLPMLKYALKEFRNKSPFRITIEYVLIKGVNMNREDAKALRKFIGDMSCKLNLIAWNENEFSDFQRPSTEEIEEFISYLHPFPVAITFRKSRGSDISAACGQLSAANTKNV